MVTTNDNIQYPKLLIVGREAWDANNSTLTGIFNNYPADRLAHICIETREPDFVQCMYHYQISEVAMIKKIFKPWIQTGNRSEKGSFVENNEVKYNEKQELKILRFVRSHRLSLFLYIRELLWLFNGWKTKSLITFIKSFDPDVVFCVGDSLPLMNKFQRGIVNSCKCPAAIFITDDIYSYINCHSVSSYVYKWLLRRQAKPLIAACSEHFAISPKMKQEYDEIFGINSILLTKGISESVMPLRQVHKPITLVYTGNLLYGRFSTIATIADVIRDVNSKGESKAELHIYTQTVLSGDMMRQINIPGVSRVHKPVAYNQLKRIYDDADIVLFVESLERKYKYIARLSFSTKITDYLSSGRCIFAVGAKDIAPIEYFNEAGIAITCNSIEEIKPKMERCINNPQVILNYAAKSAEYGIENHSSSVIHQRLVNALQKYIM